jgi:hypothetical protein
MWGWARTLVLANASVPQPPRDSPSLNFNAANESRAIIHIFAAMAMNADLQGAAP